MKQEPKLLFGKPFIVLGELPEDQRIKFMEYRKFESQSFDELNANVIPYGQYSLWYDIHFDKKL